MDRNLGEPRVSGPRYLTVNLFYFNPDTSQTESINLLW